MDTFIGVQVLSILRENAFEKEAQYLEKLLSDMSSNDKQLREAAIEGIIGCCHIHAYGNLNIRTINGWKWNTLLEKLEKYAVRRSPR